MKLARLERVIRHAEWRLRARHAQVAWLRRQGRPILQLAWLLYCLELVLDRLVERRAQLSR
ncbi:hypothetical protein [Geminicoccus flavidas]|uniref:hypothetical protein n=1 Tax=Geminicoccus flavidas TaxID=2506407 RepID=UPI001359343E|nr:hypothetical protein [Geminicoccus flavidas]